MATIRDYFDTDFSKCLSMHRDWQVEFATQSSIAVCARVSLDFDANAKYWSFFIPECGDPVLCTQAILDARETAHCTLDANVDAVHVESGFVGYPERATSKTLVFTRRVFFYVDADCSAQTRATITAKAYKSGFYVLIRDRGFARARSAIERPLAFISHDARDKDSLVRELAREMVALMCPVWYDEYSLKVGDSLRESIEKGMKEARKCVMILSPNFFSNKGWGKAEFDSIFTREIVEKGNVMLPVWHNVGRKEVYDYCPRLADRVGLDSLARPKELARKLVGQIKSASI